MATQTGSLDLKAGKSASKTATEYITEIDSNGIFISPSSQDPTETSTGNSVRINGSGMEIFNNNKSVASYGEIARIGQQNDYRTEITNNSFQIFNSEGQILDIQNNGPSKTMTMTAFDVPQGTLPTTSAGGVSYTLQPNVTYTIQSRQNGTVTNTLTYNSSTSSDPVHQTFTDVGGEYRIIIGTVEDGSIQIRMATRAYSSNHARSEIICTYQTTIDHVPQMSFIGDFYLDGAPISDFVVEQGTDGIWTYRKWNSGIAECWGRYSVTLTKYTTVGSFAGYYTTVSFPTDLFVAGSIPTHTYTATIGTGFAMPASGMNVSNTSMYVYALATASANNQSCVFDIIAKGRWK